MARVKRSVKRRNKREKVLGLAKGYWGAKGSNYRTAKEAVCPSVFITRTAIRFDPPRTCLEMS